VKLQELVYDYVFLLPIVLRDDLAILLRNFCRLSWICQ